MGNLQLATLLRRQWHCDILSQVKFVACQGGNSWIQAAQSNSVANTGARGVDGSLI